MATPKAPKASAKAPKNETEIKVENNPVEIRATLIAEGFDGISIDSMMPLLGIAFHDISALRLVLTNAKIAKEKAVQAAKDELNAKKSKREERNKADSEALAKVFASIGIKSTPECMNDVRDEERFTKKVLVKGGDAEKVHDRDLVGLRFTIGKFNYCFQAEIPFERTTGTNKFSLSKEEHKVEKEKILGEIARVILSNYSSEGVFIGG